MDPMAWLIVSCQIFQLQASLRAPQLMVTPRKSYYLIGKSLTLSCSQHGYSRGKKFIFLKDKIELSSSEWTLKDRENHYIPQLNIFSSGEYSCKYYVTSEKQSIHSLESNLVRITVLEQPPLPVFSISPKQEIYTSLEAINFTCSVSDTRNVSKIQFVKNKKNLTSLQHSSTPFTHSLNLLLQGGGNYSCRYWVVDSGQEINSQESNIISIYVTDPPPRPVLKLDPPTGVVKEGNQLIITCSTDRKNTEKRFHFYRDGIEITSADEELLLNSREPADNSTDASVALLHAKPSQTREFACSYEEKNGSHWLSSAWSQKVNITVLGQLQKVPLAYAALAIPLLFLVLLLIVCCLRKKKASWGREESERTESREEIDLDCLGIRRPGRTAKQKQKGSEITYADIRFSSSGTSRKPVVKNKFEPVEEEMVLYSKVRFQPTSRARK